MLKPDRSILDESFRYVPAAATSVAATWRRFGWRPTTDEERKMRRRPEAEEDAPVEAGARHRSSIPAAAVALERARARPGEERVAS